MEKTEPIIENSLLEAREQLELILSDKKQDSLQMEDRIITWANDMLMAATRNEPGQVRLVPPPDRNNDQVKEDPPVEPQGEYQIIGSGTSNIPRSGKHQRF